MIDVQALYKRLIELSLEDENAMNALERLRLAERQGSDE